MKNFLQEIVDKRKETVKMLKSIVPIEAWEMMPHFSRDCLSLKESLLDESLAGIIAEFKRASPSKGMINEKADLFDVVFSYEQYGASAVSILTEPVYFKGNNDDIMNVADTMAIPVLRKDFIFEEYQVAESKAIGADVILLIAACLTPGEVKSLAAYARSIGLESMLEIHNEEELNHICDEVDMVGVNNRNLKTFDVDITTSLQLIDKIPVGKPAISESGISSVDTVITLRQAGFKGFLIGENFMKEENPGKAFEELVSVLKPNQGLAHG
jgi:indole-3-glycerol phosphate synthase